METEPVHTTFVEKSTMAGIGALLAVALVIMGWTLTLSGRVGVIEGNRFTAAQGLVVSERLGSIHADIREITARIKALEGLKIPPKEVEIRLESLERGLQAVAMKMEELMDEFRRMTVPFRRDGRQQ